MAICLGKVNTGHPPASEADSQLALLLSPCTQASCHSLPEIPSGIFSLSPLPYMCQCAEGLTGMWGGQRKMLPAPWLCQTVPGTCWAGRRVPSSEQGRSWDDGSRHGRQSPHRGAEGQTWHWDPV
jgi:hypothetical protein